MLPRLKAFTRIAARFAWPVLLAGCSMGDSVNNVVSSAPDAPPSGNNAPVISGNPPSMARVGATYSFTPTASDPDADPLTFTAQNIPAWAEFDTVTGTIAGSPFLGSEGTFNDITITVSDGSLSQSLTPFTITVEPQSAPNMPPVIDGVPASTVTAGNSYSFTPTASDPDGDPLAFTPHNAPSWSVLDPLSGRLSGTPQPGDEGSYEDISISVTDGTVSSSMESFTITVEAQTSAPVISGVPDSDAVVGEQYVFRPTASDPDGDALIFDVQNKPGWLNFNTLTGRLGGTPQANDVGAYTNIVITVTDGLETASLPAFSITVAAAVNSAPIISGSPAPSVTAGQPYEFGPTASDPDGDALTFSIQNQPGWAGFDTATGKLTGTPQTGDVGEYRNIVISATDGQDTTSLPAFSISVVQVSLGSITLTWTPPTRNTDGTALTDLAGYVLSWGLAVGNYTQSVPINNPGLSSYTVDGLAPNTYYFVLTAKNSNGVLSDNSNVATKVLN